MGLMGGMKDMNEVVLLLQASNKLDEVVGILGYLVKDMKATLDADNAELRAIRDEIATLRNELSTIKGFKK